MSVEYGRALCKCQCVSDGSSVGNLPVLKILYNLLEESVGEIWDAPQWELAKNCHDCEVLGCVWYSSQLVTTFAQNYMRGLSKMISQQKPELEEDLMNSLSNK